MYKTLRPTMMAHRSKKNKPPAFKVKVDIIDIDQRKKIATMTGHGETLDIIKQMRKECQWTVRGNGKYVCAEPVVYFLRYGAPKLHGGITTTFCEEPTSPLAMDDQWEEAT